MENFQTLSIRKSNSSVEIILNRPEVHNALDEQMISDLSCAVKLYDQDSSVRYIKFSGAGKSFCAGADINWMRQAAGHSFDENIKEAHKLADLFQAIYSAGKPTLAVVKGSVFGGGVGLTAVCDMVIAAENTIFSLSEVKLGVIPAVIFPYILRAMGERQAKRYALTGERFNAETAYHMGFVHQLIKEGEEGTIEANLKLGAPTAQQETKKLFGQVVTLPISPKMRALTAHAIAKARASEEGVEGLQAFLEKRKPAWVEIDEK